MATVTETEMPAPRLELRWLDQDGLRDGYTCVCVYSLVLRLGEFDVRAEREGDDGEPLPSVSEQNVEISKTLSTGTAASRHSLGRWGIDEISTPFRDGAHAQWDTAQLGNLPIYAVANGRAMLVEPKP